MDLAAIQAIITESFGSMNIWAIITGLISGVLVKILWDNILAWALVKYWPEKYLQMFYSWVEDFDTKYLDTLPDKTRKVLEGKISEFLETLNKIIEN